MEEISDLKVTVSKVIFSRNGFYIFACKGGLSVKGKFSGNIIEGAEYIVSGVETEYKGKPQIDATSIKEQDSDSIRLANIAAFLADTFDGIGPKTSVRLSERYGESIIDALLETPEECAVEAPGLSSVRACEISGIIDEEPDRFRTLLSLRIYELSQAQSELVWDEFGPKCIELIKKNPYCLMSCKGIGFESCDRIADITGFSYLDANRFEGAVISVLLDMHQASGDTFFDAADVRHAVVKTVKGRIQEEVSSEVIESLLDMAEEQAVEHKRIVIYRFADSKCSACKSSDSDARVALTAYFQAELTVKREIESFLKASRVIPKKEEALSALDSLADEMGYVLEQSQRDALYMSMYQPFSIITGGPGTGKTTITGILSEYFKRQNIECAFCAPTGRAAKRLSDAAGVRATTIHRLLEINGESQLNDGPDFLFGKGPENPIDARVIVVDEASMVDVQLFKSLLQAVRKNASVILIGDPNQLPSVGPGNVLADLLSCEAIPRVSLSYIFRQDSESSIAGNSNRILQGLDPISDNDEFTVISTESDEEAEILIRDISKSIGNDSDSVILCPTKQNLLGTSRLNSELQRLYNADSASHIKLRADLELCNGDKVMQMKNNYKIEYFDPSDNELQTGIYNGEIGVVANVDFMTGGCDIRFDGGRLVAYDRKTLSDVDLAYAMTVHKAQGCEFDTVIIALGKMNYKLSNRRLLYTAVTRGKRKVIIVDSCGRLHSMVTSGVDSKRRTSLCDFLSIVSKRYL